MPVQHGSDAVLKRMRRGLGSEGIKKRINELRDVNSDIVLRTSIIVGFPGETEDDFQRLYDMIEEIEFDRLGVFTYSEEERTYGAILEDDVPAEIKTERMDSIMMLQQEINLRKNEALIGSREKVLIDFHSEDDTSIGRTYRDAPEVDNSVRIVGKLPIGNFVNVKITQASEYEMKGETLTYEPETVYNTGH